MTTLLALQGSTALSQMVFEHLKHSGYWRTAEALAGEVGGSWVPVSSSDVQEQQAREQVSAAVRQGLIHEAMALAENLAPGVINAHPSVALQLELQAFIELVGCCPTLTIVSLLAFSLLCKVKRACANESVVHTFPRFLSFTWAGFALAFSGHGSKKWRDCCWLQPPSRLVDYPSVRVADFIGTHDGLYKSR